MMSNVSAAAHLNIRLVPQDVSEPGQFEDAFAGMLRQHVGALFVFGDPMLGKYRMQIAELAMKSRLPSMHTNRPHVEAGGLMSYGPSFTDLWQRAAVYVDKLARADEVIE
jgi:putative ABC transport system substrate-binding protein